MPQQRKGAKTSISGRRPSRTAGRNMSRNSGSSKWIDSPADHEDRKGQSLATRNHDVIMHWAEERKGQPAVVPGTGREKSAGILRVDFPGFAKLQQTSWDEWFKTFDERQLTFLFQEHKKNGDVSTFFKLRNPERQRKAA
ncbi:MAG TPA: hypothetical protein VHO84_04735 [Syntrophorhabdaceae bacterium]|nr:hypothetical protein [Syntrophorhabdaceae bacterium]